MSQKDKPKKRVVSKAKYMEYAVAKTAWSSVGGLAVTFGLSVAILASFVASVSLMFWIAYFGQGGGWLFFSWICASVVIGVISGALAYLGAAMLRKAGRMEPVAPLTRHTVGDLPDLESLVRASEEPSQRLEKSLLRAACAGQETAAEELLRPHE